jgi:large subunit ribosomal protein L24
VIVTAGRDKGKRAKSRASIPPKERVLVSGVNVVKRHQRQTATAQGGIISKERRSICPRSRMSIRKPGAHARRIQNLVDGRRVAFAKKSGEVLDV